MQRSLVLPLVLPLVVVAACERQLGTPATDDHGDAPPDLTIVAGQIEDRFSADGDRWLSPALALDEGANRVALMATLAEGEALPAVEVRGVDGAERGPWSLVSWTFEELGHLAGFGALDGVYRAVQVAIPRDDAGAFARLTFSPAFVSDEEEVALAPSDVESELVAELAFVGVKPRSAWGARASRCTTKDGDFYRMALHHTAAAATGNVELALRQAQAYHMDGRGYCDIAYHFGVAQDGRVFELRAMPFRGGHTLNNNTGNVGIVFLGCFDPACGNDQPSAALLSAGAGIVRMMHLLEGIPVDGEHVRAHRDHSYAQTACPGANLYPRVGEIRAQASVSAPPPPPPPAPTGCGILGPGAQLAKGAELTSCDGRLRLAHQGDGNVVLYHGSQALWATGTNGQATGTFVMQGDGNLVLYSPWGSPLWSSGTHGRVNAWLALQGDGNLVIYQGQTPLWATGTSIPPPPPPPPPPGCGTLASGATLAPGDSKTSCDGRFSFVHQGDGNVVLYQGATALWSTGTHGRATQALVMQGDGNLVLYAPGGAALWASGTHGHGGARLAVQSDGNAVVYQGSSALWATGTCCR